MPAEERAESAVGAVAPGGPGTHALSLEGESRRVFAERVQPPSGCRGCALVRSRPVWCPPVPLNNPRAARAWSPYVASSKMWSCNGMPRNHAPKRRFCSTFLRPSRSTLARIDHTRLDGTGCQATRGSSLQRTPRGHWGTVSFWTRIARDVAKPLCLCRLPVAGDRWT